MKITLLLLALLLPVAPLFAQNANPEQESEEQEEAPENTSDDFNRKARWLAELPGGKYAVSLKAITAISKHSYVLDGTLLVTEVSIDTTGSTLVRFYHIEPITSATKFDSIERLKDRVKSVRKEVQKKTGIKVGDMAQKSYPTTTHAKTIEFRVLTEGELNALYKSAFTSWDTGKGRTFKIR